MDVQYGGAGRDELGNQDWHVYTTMRKIDSQQEPAVQNRELSSVLSGDLDVQEGRETKDQEGGDICVNTDDSLHCTAETNTVL